MAVARLKNRADFVAVQQGGRRVTTSAFIMLFLPHDGPLVVGYTASKKLGNAVARNRAKRRMKALVERHARQSPLAGKLVLIAKSAVLTTAFDSLEAELQRGLRSLEGR